MKNKKFYVKLLIWKMEKQNLDFEVARTPLLKWIRQFRIIWKRCRHFGFCDFRYKSCSQWVLFMIMRLVNRRARFPHTLFIIISTRAFPCLKLIRYTVLYLRILRRLTINGFDSKYFLHTNIENLILSPMFFSN